MGEGEIQEERFGILNLRGGGWSVSLMLKLTKEKACRDGLIHGVDMPPTFLDQSHLFL